MEENLPEGLTIFQLLAKHRKRMRTSNSLERLHEEINRRTRVARLFPNEASLLRLVSAIEMEISGDQRRLDSWQKIFEYANGNGERKRTR